MGSAKETTAKEYDDDDDDYGIKMKIFMKGSMVIWWLMCVIGTSGFIFHSYELISEYLNYPVVMTEELWTGSAMEFPAVTVCSHSKYRRSKMWIYCQKSNRNSKLCSDIQTPMLSVFGDSILFEPEVRVSKKVIPPPTTFKFCDREELFINRSESNVGNSSQYYSRSTNANDKEKTESFEKKVERYLREIEYEVEDVEKIEMGYTFDDLFKKCMFMGEPCTSSNFSQTYSFQFGNCYTFKPFGIDGYPFVTTRSGPQFSLKLDLYAEESERVAKLDVYEGFRVVIHSHDELKFVEDEGFDVNLGYRTSLPVQQSIKEWLSSPYYPHCKDVTSRLFFRDDQEICSYSVGLCHKYCLQEKVWRSCNCLDPRLSYHEMSFTGKICDINNQSQICCLEETLESMTSGILCDCPIPCRQEEYDNQISNLIWVPNNEEIPLKLDRSKYARVEVYFRSMDKVIRKSKPKYLLVDVFSSLGGEIGLWLGVSFITFHQIAEDFICSIYNSFYKKKTYNLSS